MYNRAPTTPYHINMDQQPYGKSACFICQVPWKGDDQGGLCRCGKLVHAQCVGITPRRVTTRRAFVLRQKAPTCDCNTLRTQHLQKPIITKTLPVGTDQAQIAVSYSLFGVGDGAGVPGHQGDIHPWREYVIGLWHNILFMLANAPNWKVLVYVDHLVPATVLRRLSRYQNVRVILVATLCSNGAPGRYWGTFWRFLAYDEPNFACFFSRDADDRLTKDALEVMEDFLASPARMHAQSARDVHCVNAGWFGMKAGVMGPNFNMQSALWSHRQHTHTYGADEVFLSSLWSDVPREQRIRMRHDRPRVVYPEQEWLAFYALDEDTSRGSLVNWHRVLTFA